MHNETYGPIIGKTGTSSIARRALPRGHRALAAMLEDAVIGFFDVVLAWHENARSRYDLAQLDDRMLSDIGISRATAEREGSAPFWR
jgi:uncharacterized protein YjiS (DUF1127 family)